jgi:hypothetical protein
MTTNDMDAEAVVLDQTYFALDAEGFAAFQGLVDNPPSARPATPHSHNPVALGRCVRARQSKSEL